jgi:cell wall-associated NlpC family hydrolase
VKRKREERLVLGYKRIDLRAREAQTKARRKVGLKTTKTDTAARARRKSGWTHRKIGPFSKKTDTRTSAKKHWARHDENRHPHECEEKLSGIHRKQILARARRKIGLDTKKTDTHEREEKFAWTQQTKTDTPTSAKKNLDTTYENRHSRERE